MVIPAAILHWENSIKKDNRRYLYNVGFVSIHLYIFILDYASLSGIGRRE